MGEETCFSRATAVRQCKPRYNYEVRQHLTQPATNENEEMTIEMSKLKIYISEILFHSNIYYFSFI